VIKELARIHRVYKGRYLDELQEVARDYTENAVITDKTGNTRPLSPGSLKNKLSYLRAACRYAQKYHRIGKGVVFDIEMPAVNNERQYHTDRAGMLSIARRCKNRHARALVRLSFYSGMRIGELLDIGHGARIADGGFWLVDTKNGSDRVVPIHPRLNVLLRYLPIPYKKRWMQRLIRTAMNSVGLEHFVLHDLRHSTASMLINNDVDLHTIGAILGHKDKRSTDRYSHLTAKTLARAINKIR
jgi:integrase